MPQEDMSTMPNFLEVSGRWLANAKPLGLDWRIWLMLGLLCFLCVGTYFWFKKKREVKK